MPSFPGPAEALAVEPIERAFTIPAAWYTSPAMAAFEQAAVFGQAWHYAGHGGRLGRPGAFLTADVGGHSLVIVRGEDGEVRAFYNVCRHRGGPLATTPCGHARLLQCRYHGWTYRLDGSLRGVPRFDRSELFDKRDYGLVPVAVDVWQNLVFVHLGQPAEPLAAVLAGIAERIAPLHLGGLHFAQRVDYDVACNWKVYVDNYLEGYHLPLVHPELCRVLDYRAYATETFGHYSLQHSPLREAEAVYGTSDGAAYYYFVFPNLMLNILPGRLQTNVVLPLGPDRCRVVFEYYFDDVASPAARQRIADDVAFSDRVQQEDVAICEHVQRGLHSPAYDQGRFSPEAEQGVYHFQGLLKEAYARAAQSSKGARRPS